MTLRLVELEAPLDDVDFPNGANHVPVPFGPTEYRLWRELSSEPDPMKRGRMLMDIVTACYPTATADDIDSCTPTMLIAMAAHAGRKIDQIRDALKNVAGAVAAAATEPPQAAATPSSPRTSGGSSSRNSRGRSAKTPGTSPSAAPTASPT